MILALLLHAYFSAVLAYAFALFFGYLSPFLAALALIGGLAMGVYTRRQLSRISPEFEFSEFNAGASRVVELTLVVFVLYVSIRHFAWLFFYMNHGFSTLTSFNFGDLPLHINYIRALANGGAFPLQNPSFASEVLRYPLGVDLYNSLWESLKAPLAGHLAVTGVVAAAASVVMLRSFAGWWGIGAFFLSGGLAGWGYLQGQPIDRFQAQVEWKNLFLTVFVTQRGILFALPVGLLLLKSFREHFSRERVLSKKLFLTLGFVWGMLPLFHLHSFVVISLIIGGYFLIERGKGALQDILDWRFLLLLFVPSIGMILFSTGLFQRVGVAHWDWAWLAPKGDEFWFFINNFGLWLFLPLAIGLGLWFARKRIERNRYQRLWWELGLYVGLLILFFNLMLAPWAWDNVKVLIWPYLGLARLAWVVLEDYLGTFSRIALAVLLFFTGVVSLSESIQMPSKRSTEIYRIEELARVEGALADVTSSAVFVAAPQHHHPLTYFGRIRVMGYEGHLWSHGVDSAQIQLVKSQQSDLMKGQGDWRALMKSLGATHIFWGPAERAEYGEGHREWMLHLRNVSRVPGYEVYSVQ